MDCEKGPEESDTTGKDTAEAETVASKAEANELVAYVHNISPVKSGKESVFRH